MGRLVTSIVAIAVAVGARSAHASPGTVPAPEGPGWLPLPLLPTYIRFSGYAKLDAIYDLDAPQGYYMYVPGVPLDGTAAARRRGQTSLHARESRLRIETRTPQALWFGSVSTLLEADFLTDQGTETQTNSTRLRLRRYFGTIGRVLAGQEWSTFMDLEVIPETVDDSGPSGQIFIRQPQIRYTHPIGSQSHCAVALENPSSDFLASDGPAAQPLQRLPDAVGRCTASGAWWRISLSALGREFRTDDGAGRTDAALGYGLGVAGSIRIAGKHRLLYELNGGRGIGRYVIDLAGYGARWNGDRVRPLLASGGFLAYEHWWAGTVRSTLLYSRTRIHSDLPDSARSPEGSPPANRTTQSIHVNLYWNIAPTVEVGLEYIRGSRETFDGVSGNADRLQFGVTFYLLP